MMRQSRVSKIRSPKDCFFCKSQSQPDYKDVSVLIKFLSERGKIVAHTKTGICSKHQRLLTDEIKHARHVALLPFLVRV